MGFRPRLDPRVVDRGGGVRSNFRDKLVRALTKATIGTKRDGLKTDVELLVSDDGVGAIVLGLSHFVGGGTTNHTRQGVKGRVDGGVSDTNVQDVLGLVEQTYGTVRKPASVEANCNLSPVGDVIEAKCIWLH